MMAAAFSVFSSGPVWAAASPKVPAEPLPKYKLEQLLNMAHTAAAMAELASSVAAIAATCTEPTSHQNAAPAVTKGNCKKRRTHQGNNHQVLCSCGSGPIWLQRLLCTVTAQCLQDFCRQGTRVPDCNILAS